MYQVPKRLFGAAILLVGLAHGASAASVNISVDSFGISNLAGAQAAYASYKSTTHHSVVEDFESFQAWSVAPGATNPVQTKAGTFHAESALPGGPGGSSVNGGNNLEIRANDGVGNSPDGTLWGRQNLTLGGMNWLDSNDLTAMVWTIGSDTKVGKFDSLAFVLGDVGDISGTNFTIKVEAAGYATKVASIARQPNGTMNLVQILFDDFVKGAKVTLTSNRNDGFGIDNVTVARVAPVPLPGAGLLLLGGLASLGAFRRRRAAA